MSDAASDRALAELRAPLVSTEQVHLNNAGVSPMTLRARDTGVLTFERMREGSLAVGGLLHDYEAARATFARLLGAAHDDTSFFQTCAAAISQVAFGMKLAAGDEILLVDQEYPSNAYPWHRAAERAGARVVVVASAADYAIDVDRLLGAVSKRTRVIAVSSVQYSTGTTLPLRPLADAVHANGGWLVLDAIQGLGVLPLDLATSGADAICGGAHKWLLGPIGHGFLALAPGRAVELQPLMHGAMTYGTPDDLVDPARLPRTDPRRFEPGTPLLLGALAAAASVELLLQIGIDRVHAEATAIADLVVAAARKRGLVIVHGSGPLRSPITTVVPRRREPTELVAALRARGCSTAARGGGVRISPHAHNGPQHVERLFSLWDDLDR